MACTPVLSGNSFVVSAMAHLDCQGQTIGAYGYASLAHPGSSVAVALGGLLTLFVALFGARLMLGQAVDGRDLVSHVLRIGIVLTLAGSWPAWRVLGYDVVMQGPEQLADSIGHASGLWDSALAMPDRLQGADNGLVAMTAIGSGRLTGDGAGGGAAGEGDAAEPFRGIALPDYMGLGLGRSAFLVGVLGPYALLRLGSGMLLAVAPLMAGLLLFGATLPVFMGWVRGLIFCALGSLAFALMQGVQLAVLEPWIADVLRARDVNSFAPSAPTELLVIALAFVSAIGGLLVLVARISFASFQPVAQLRLPPPDPAWRDARVGAGGEAGARPAFDAHRAVPMELHSRAHGVADAVAMTMRREDAAAAAGRAAGGEDRSAPSVTVNAGSRPSTELLGSTFRRSRTRVSSAGNRRDTGS